MPPTPQAPQQPVAPTPSPAPARRGLREVLMGAFVVVAALLIIALMLSPEWRGMMFPFLSEHPPAPVVEEMVEPVRESEVLEGTIYMSLAPTAAESHYALNVYSYDVETARIMQVTNEVNREFFTSDISPDGMLMAVVSVTNNGETLTSPTKLYLRDMLTTDMTEVVVTEPVATIRSPHWSADGSMLVFQVLPEASLDQIIPENWDVYVYTLGDQTAKRLAPGANPKLLPNGDVLVLQSAGIAVVDGVSGESKSLAVPFESGDLGTNSKFDVSQDGTMLAVAYPDSNVVVVTRVDSWQPFTSEVITRIETGAFWPVFSPGGEYLALQAFEWSDDTEERVPLEYRLALFSIRENEWVDVVDLMPYQQDMLFITDWR